MNAADTAGDSPAPPSPFFSMQEQPEGEQEVKPSVPTDPRPNPSEEPPFESFTESSKWEMPPNLEGEMTASTPLLLRLSDFPEPEHIGPVMAIMNDNGGFDQFASPIVIMTMREPRNEVKRRLILAALKVEGAESMLQTYIEAINICLGPRKLTSEGNVLGSSDQPIPVQTFVQRVCEILLRSEGGLLSAVHAAKCLDPKIWIKTTNESRWAGSILFQILQLSQSGRFPTIRKVIHIQAKSTKRYGKEAPGSPQRFLEIWEAYKPAAHLLAARHYWEEVDKTGVLLHLFFSQNLLKGFLTVAELFRRFGTQYKPSGSDEPLLPPADTWRCPDDVQFLDPPIPFLPLSEEIAKLYDDAQEDIRERKKKHDDEVRAAKKKLQEKVKSGINKIDRHTTRNLHLFQEAVNEIWEQMLAEALQTSSPHPVQRAAKELKNKREQELTRIKR
jgi:hypothetical protein